MGAGRRRWILIIGVLACIVVPVACALASYSWAISRPDSPATLPLPCTVDFSEAGWNAKAAQRCPETVTALTSADWDGIDRVYVGTGPIGSVYVFTTSRGNIFTTVATVAAGLGDTYAHGICCVSGLGLHDLDHDGMPELLATTSQIVPQGRPRLYVWSLIERAILLGTARPDIRSSWSHGLGCLSFTPGSPSRVFSAFCGYGEVVEYQLTRADAGAGLQYQTVGWRSVGHLPASGEGAQVADVDNDGQPDVCVATGYATGRAAIHVYEPTAEGITDRPKYIWDEGGRFGNVRFLVGNLCSDGFQEVIAWWCTGLRDGECTVARYHLDPDGSSRRIGIAQGNASTLWPIDGQMALADMDGDGAQEVWFASNAGHLWRYDPRRSPALAEVARTPEGIGPILADTDLATGQCRLFIGWEDYVLELDRKDVPGDVSGQGSRATTSSQVSFPFTRPSHDLALAARAPFAKASASRRPVNGL